MEIKETRFLLCDQILSANFEKIMFRFVFRSAESIASDEDEGEPHDYA